MLRRRISGRIAGGIAIALLFSGLLATPSDARAQLRTGVEAVGVYLSSPTNWRRHYLSVQVLPRLGLAVAETLPEIEGPRGVAYATAIPRTPFHGSLDVRFPGLGRIVGKVVGKPGSKPCETRSATFRGTLSFHGAGDHEQWSARRAGGELTPVCAPFDTPKGKGTQLLFNAVAERGPGFHGGSDGPFSILRANNPGIRRATELFAFAYGRGPGETLLFNVDDYEYVGHGVVCNRWASVGEIPRRTQFEIAPGIRFPATATIRPGGLFSGEATYSRKDHSFVGDLSVHLLGRTVRLAGRDAGALVQNQL